MIFEGIPSGDLECFCLLVTKETFKALTGNDPNRKWDVGRFAEKGSPHRYVIYPCQMFGFEPGEKSLHVISVEAVKKEKLK